MLTDPISDMLTRIRNASIIKKPTVNVPLSKIKYAIAKILEKEGYISGVETFEDGPRNMMRLTLKYAAGKVPAIETLTRISKPGRRIYTKAADLKSVRSGFGMSIISTPNGLMTSKDATKRRLGGEIICEIF